MVSRWWEGGVSGDPEASPLTCQGVGMQGDPPFDGVIVLIDEVPGLSQ